jgi:hypothetical protein
MMGDGRKQGAYVEELRLAVAEAEGEEVWCRVDGRSWDSRRSGIHANDAQDELCNGERVSAVKEGCHEHCNSCCVSITCRARSCRLCCEFCISAQDAGMTSDRAWDPRCRCSWMRSGMPAPSREMMRRIAVNVLQCRFRLVLLA